MISGYDAYLIMGGGMAVFAVIFVALVYLSDYLAARQERQQHRHPHGR